MKNNSRDSSLSSAAFALTPSPDITADKIKSFRECPKDWVNRLDELLKSSPHYPGGQPIAMQLQKSADAIKPYLADALRLLYVRLHGGLDDQLGPLKKTEKSAMLSRLCESSAEQCSSGFQIRVNTLIQSLQLPNNLSELLYKVRCGLVEQVAYELIQLTQHAGNEIHSYNQSFQIASVLGLGVHGIKDAYAELSDYLVLEGIANKFYKNYRACNLPFLLEPLLRNVYLAQLGYAGKKDSPLNGNKVAKEGEAEGYLREVYEPIKEYIEKLIGVDEPMDFTTFFVVDEAYHIVDVHWLNVQKQLFMALFHQGFIKEVCFEFIEDYADYWILTAPDDDPLVTTLLQSNKNRYADLVDRLLDGTLINFLKKMPDMMNACSRHEETGNTLFHHAIKRNAGTIKQWMLDNKADHNLPNHSDVTPFLLALQDKDFATANAILAQSNSTVRIPTVGFKYVCETVFLTRKNPVENAFASINKTILTIYKAQPLLLTVRLKDGYTLLQHCLGVNRAKFLDSLPPEVVSTLFKKFPKLLRAKVFHETLLEIAIKEGQIVFLQHLKNAQIPLRCNHCGDSNWEKGATPLAFAAGWNKSNLQTLALLLSFGADPINTARTGRTALAIACKYGYLDRVQLLLNIPLVRRNINRRDEHFQTALHHAVESSSLPIIQALLTVKNLDPNVQDDANDTPLHLAVKKGNYQIVVALIQLPGIEIYRKNEDNLAPFTMALQQNDAPMIQAFLRCFSILSLTASYKAARRLLSAVMKEEPAILQHQLMLLDLHHSADRKLLNWAASHNKELVMECITSHLLPGYIMQMRHTAATKGSMKSSPVQCFSFFHKRNTPQQKIAAAEWLLRGPFTTAEYKQHAAVFHRGALRAVYALMRKYKKIPPRMAEPCEDKIRQVWVHR